MSGILQSSVGLMRSRLSRRIVFWIFLSLLTIEGIIFVPSLYQRRQEKLKELEAVSSEVLFSLKVEAMANGTFNANMLKQLQAKLKPDSVILGAILYSADCRRIDAFGELPEIACPTPAPTSRGRQSNANGQRYDVYWPTDFFQGRYILAVRHNAQPVQRHIVEYGLTIGGLVVLISAFVTFTTILVLERLLINPLLRLRDDLLAAGEAVSRDQPPNFYAHSLRRADELGEVASAFNQMFHRVQYEIKERKEAEAALQIEQDKSERLLKNILPASIAEQLKQETGAIASRFDEATILFADIVDFTGLSAKTSPTQLVCLLNDIFSTFDAIAERLGLEKIKTIGDAYMVVGGLPSPRPDHTEAVMAMAIAMLEAIQTFQRPDGIPFELRIGINTGPVVAGVIGIRKFSYDLWGDAVNVASRMESQGLISHIQVTEAVYRRLQDHYPFQCRGPVAIKGRGDLITYLYSLSPEA